MSDKNENVYTSLRCYENRFEMRFAINEEAYIELSLRMQTRGDETFNMSPSQNGLGQDRGRV